MNHGKYLMIMALLSIAPQIHASENLAKINENANNNRNSSKMSKKQSVGDANQVYETEEAPDGYFEKLDDTKTFVNILNMIKDTSNKIQHPVALNTTNYKNGIQFNVEPKIELENGLNIGKAKFTVSFRAIFL